MTACSRSRRWYTAALILAAIILGGSSFLVVGQAACVDINKAIARELEKIIHIGPERADQIIKLRPFRSVDELVRVRGIAAARLADIKKQGIACVK